MIDNWIENPYFQCFADETYFQTDLPIDPPSTTRWRPRIGEEAVDKMLAATIDAAHRIWFVKAGSVDKVIVDMTVRPKVVAPPTGSRLLEKSRPQLVKLVIEQGLVMTH